MYEGLSMVWEMGFKQVEIECDAQELVILIKTNNSNDDEGDLINHISELIITSVN